MSLASRVNALATAVGLRIKAVEASVIPVLYWNPTSSSWPARTVPSGYTGPVTWDSTGYPAATSPPAVVNGDYWNTAVISYFIMQAPNGSRYRVTITNSGNLDTGSPL